MRRSDHRSRVFAISLTQNRGGVAPNEDERPDSVSREAAKETDDHGEPDVAGRAMILGDLGRVMRLISCLVVFFDAVGTGDAGTKRMMSLSPPLTIPYAGKNRAAEIQLCLHGSKRFPSHCPRTRGRGIKHQGGDRFEIPASRPCRGLRKGDDHRSPRDPPKSPSPTGGTPWDHVATTDFVHLDGRFARRCDGGAAGVPALVRTGEKGATDFQRTERSPAAATRKRSASGPTSQRTPNRA